MNDRSYIIPHRDHAHYVSDAKLLSLKRWLSFPKEATLRQIIKNLSDPTKLKIYLLLHKVGEMAVSDITIILGISQSTVSHALTDLKNVGIVESHRCGQLICYSLTQVFKNNPKLRFLDRFLGT